MIHAQNSKVVALFKPQSVATNGTASGTVNCVGYDYAVVTLHLDTAVSSNVDELVQLSESDGTTYATHADFAMTTAAPDTNNQQFYRWYVNLKARKKNLKIEYSPSTSAARIAAASVELSRAEQVPITAANRGLAGQVITP